MKWTACELHSHTVHSDGDYTVSHLLNEAKRLGIEAIAITDHSTESAHDEVEKFEDGPCIPVIRGLEWTTFYGHALIIGCREQIDWRKAEPDTIDDFFRLVQAAGGITGVSHPYALGYPICCGCHWEFKLKDWTLADMIEIWSGEFPQWKRHNQKAVDTWTSLLDRGIYTTAIAARDWHGEREDHTKPFAVTYLLLDERNDVTESVKEAVRKHHAYVTVGPTMSVKASSYGIQAGIGESLLKGTVDFTITVCEGSRRHIWNLYDLIPESLVIIGYGGREVARKAFPGYGNETVLKIPNASGWLRVELHGTMLGKQAILAAANPIVCL